MKMDDIYAAERRQKLLLLIGLFGTLSPKELVDVSRSKLDLVLQDIRALADKGLITHPVSLPDEWQLA